MRPRKNSGAKTAQMGGGSRFGGISRPGCFDRRHNEFFHLASERLWQLCVEMEVIFYDCGMKNPAASIRSGKLRASVRLGRSARNDFDESQWMADLYTFGGILSRIDQATDRRDSPYDHAQANPVEMAKATLGAGVKRTAVRPRSKVFLFRS